MIGFKKIKRKFSVAFKKPSGVILSTLNSLEEEDDNMFDTTNSIKKIDHSTSKIANGHCHNLSYSSSNLLNGNVADYNTNNLIPGFQKLLELNDHPNQISCDEHCDMIMAIDTTEISPKYIPNGLSLPTFTTPQSPAIFAQLQAQSPIQPIDNNTDITTANIDLRNNYSDQLMTPSIAATTTASNSTSPAGISSSIDMIVENGFGNLEMTPVTMFDENNNISSSHGNDGGPTALNGTYHSTVSLQKFSQLDSAHQTVRPSHAVNQPGNNSNKKSNFAALLPNHQHHHPTKRATFIIGELLDEGSKSGQEGAKPAVTDTGKAPHPPFPRRFKKVQNNNNNHNNNNAFNGDDKTAAAFRNKRLSGTFTRIHKFLSFSSIHHQPVANYYGSSDNNSSSRIRQTGDDDEDTFYEAEGLGSLDDKTDPEPKTTRRNNSLVAYGGNFYKRAFRSGSSGQQHPKNNVLGEDQHRGNTSSNTQKLSSTLSFLGGVVKKGSLGATGANKPRHHKYPSPSDGSGNSEKETTRRRGSSAVFSYKQKQKRPNGIRLTASYYGPPSSSSTNSHHRYPATENSADGSIIPSINIFNGDMYSSDGYTNPYLTITNGDSGFISQPPSSATSKEVRALSQEEISKRLSLPVDIHIPEGFLVRNFSQPLLNGPLSRKDRRDSLYEIGFGRTDTYTKLDKIGEGTYATVYRGKSRLTDTFVALKEIRLEYEEGAPCTAIREVSLLKNLKHANIVTLHDIIHTKTSLTLVFEYLERDLKQYMEDCDNILHMNNVKLFMFQLFRGLEFCHRKQILHRDLKPQNLLINKIGELKLADFGLARAKSVPTKTFSNEVVTLWYRPPEVLLGSTEYSTPIDIWGVGCIFYEMATGKPLFPGSTVDDQLKVIWQTLGPPPIHIPLYANASTPYSNDSPGSATNVNVCNENYVNNLKLLAPRLDKDALNLLYQCLEYDPKRRIPAKAALRHDYFKSLPESVHHLSDTTSIFALPNIKIQKDPGTKNHHKNTIKQRRQSLL